MTLFRTYTSQQAKDAGIIQKEVLNEYDVKFVRPRTRPEYRDVSTQFNVEKEEEENVVVTGRPSTVINRGFKTNPNPNYARHVDPDGVGTLRDFAPSRRTSFGITSPTTNQMQTPQQVLPQQVLRTPAHLRDVSSPLRPSTAVRQPNPTPQLQQQTPSFRASIGTGGGDGGSLGIYSNARSPLRKSASTNFNPRASGVGYGYDGEDGKASPEKDKRPGSPLKRSGIAGSGGLDGRNLVDRFGHLRDGRGGRNGRRESDRF
jgi:hypothetical protein